ncbi:MAG TPA: FAD-binding oxidoreductase [Candidatus Saccharimonadales bacterium]|nr:FAD-binding oxidoreductase [Candidatus Saccharimonadales bacterium]
MVATAVDLSVFNDIVGAEHVREAAAGDAIHGVSPSAVVSPATEAEVSAVLAAATSRNLAVVPRGGGTKLDWGAPPSRCDLVLSTSRIEGIVDHEPADLVCVARAGTTLAGLQSRLASTEGFRQRLMLDPPHGAAATLGGVLATAASGALRTRFGTPRDLVIGASFVLSDGTIGRSGGKVVKNVAGFDIAKLLTGSLGTLAVVTELAFRLHPLPAASATVVLESRSVDELCAFAAAVGRLQVTPSVVDLHWPDGIVVVRFDSSPEGAAVQAERVTQAAGGRVLDQQEAESTAAALATTPWQGSGSVAGIAVLPSRSASLLTALSGGTCEALVLRPLLGIGEVCCAPDSTSDVAAAVRKSGGRLAMRRGDGANVGVDDGVALDLMRSVKHRLDPAGTLSPGRQLGGI